MMGKEGGVGFEVEVWTEKLDFYFNVALKISYWLIISHSVLNPDVNFTCLCACQFHDEFLSYYNSPLCRSVRFEAEEWTSLLEILTRILSLGVLS